MTINTKCKLCGSAETTYLGQVDGYQEGSQFEICYCSTCETNFVNTDNLDTSIYQLIYKNAADVPGYSRYFTFAKEIANQSQALDYLANKEAMYWAVKKVLMEDKKVIAPSKATLLEVGSGLGYLTYALDKEGYNIRGVDISSNAVEEAMKNFGNLFFCGNIFELDESYCNKYDYIILNEVIEHVPNPFDFIECLLKMLTGNGKLIVTTPNKSISIPKSIWDSELPPVHLFWFSEKSMYTVANKLNANVSFVDFSEFTKNNFDSMRFKYYSPLVRKAIFGKQGELLQSVAVDSGLVKPYIKRLLLALSNFPILGDLLTRREYPINKSNTLAVVFSKSS